MKKLIMTSFMLLMVLCFAQVGSASTIGLFEYAFNVNGSVYDYINDGTDGNYGLFPTGVNGAGFNKTTGLGTITATITGVGNHYFGAFFDHEIVEGENTYFNEYGSVFNIGSAASDQSWEIDEPGYYFGDIYSNFIAEALENSNGVTVNSPDDVSMAMGWNFELLADQTAIIQWILSTESPDEGFYLSQTDPNSHTTIYLKSSLVKEGGDNSVPEPSTIILFGLGLLGLAKAGRKR